MRGVDKMGDATRVYFIGDFRGMSAAEAKCIDGAFDFPINYQNLQRLLTGKRVAMAIGNPFTFTRLDDGFCREGIYSACNVDVCACPRDFERFYGEQSPDVVLTDAVDFARELKRRCL